ncbi:KTSC domain-containing protein [Providencia rettgeri]|uniref:KTSC domain-containing protein n=2 Tax=Providencia TaxID=586 RepID=UPI002880F00C
MYRLLMNLVEIESIEYNHDNKTLEIGFHNKLTHQYKNVPYIEYQRLIISKDIPLYINRCIKDKYIEVSKC